MPHDGKLGALTKIKIGLMNTVHPSHSPTKLIMMLVSTAASHGEDTAYAESQ